MARYTDVNQTAHDAGPRPDGGRRSPAAMRCLVLGLLALMLAACGGGGSGESPVAPGDGVSQPTTPDAGVAPSTDDPTDGAVGGDPQDDDGTSLDGAGTADPDAPGNVDGIDMTDVPALGQLPPIF